MEREGEVDRRANGPGRGPGSGERPTVVLLHGLARTHRSMAPLRRAVERAGYPVWCESYPSRKGSVQNLADEVAARIEASVGAGAGAGAGGGGLVAVTHSLGGILVRHMAARLPWTGAVLIAPPNRGSRVAASLASYAPFAWLYGPAGLDLASCDAVPPPPSPFGVIAGTRGLAPTNPVSWFTSGARIFPRGVVNDGTVALDETILPGMAAFATVDATHTWIMDHPKVLRCVLAFLERGTFGPDGEAVPG